MSVNITVVRMRSDGRRMAGAREELLDLLGITVRVAVEGNVICSGKHDQPRAGNVIREVASLLDRHELLLAVKHQRRHADAGQDVPDVGLDNHAEQRARHLRRGGRALEDARVRCDRARCRRSARTPRACGLRPSARPNRGRVGIRRPNAARPGCRRDRGFRSRRCRRGSVRAFAQDRSPRTRRSSPRPLTVRTARRAPSRPRPSRRARRPCGLRAAPARRPGRKAPCHACRTGSAARTRRAC